MSTFENVDSNRNDENDSRVPCALCGRKFNSDRLQRHLEVCEKQQQKKRKVFDSSKQRSVTDENGAPIVLSKQDLSNQHVSHSKHKQKAKPSVRTISEKPENESNTKSNWRAKHEEFIRTVRAARGEKVDEPEKSSSGIPVKRIPVGYVECPTCGRAFTKGTAERHIPWCKEQKARIPRSPVSGDALAKFRARTQYRAVPVKKSNKTTVDGVNGSVYRQNGYSSSSASVGSGKKSGRNSSPSRKDSSTSKVTTISRVKARLEQEQTKHHPKTPVMKFKEKFPNHAKSSDYIRNTDNLREILKRPNTLSGPQVPKTVPGVRTGGISPAKLTNFEDDELTKLKSRLEEMGINSGFDSKRFPTPANGIINKPSVNEIDILSRESTPGSNDGNSVTAGSRSNSSKENGSHTGLPRFCHQCGTKYPITVAKYCYECGARRLGTVGPFLTN
ncbi:zinc finger C2HC domain-containing protein 1A-like isoform X2 [Dinothrombium tinctorium]|uniref:Zinc finger C2HC domain-containing protein 1A-like isoform X2 n=1 Tax=Dinothrombium tinctorium TaxID=1965070 RepID=A0A443RQ70_9ACAR|nr:zinc finger C2HC domain-containing protein 1A-like isoform X2 [Dinothrombium tinctorium]